MRNGEKGMTILVPCGGGPSINSELISWYRAAKSLADAVSVALAHGARAYRMKKFIRGVPDWVPEQEGIEA